MLQSMAMRYVGAVLLLAACHGAAPETSQQTCARLGLRADQRLEECGYRVARSADVVTRDCAGYSEHGRQQYIADFKYVIDAKTCEAVKLREIDTERRRMKRLQDFLRTTEQ